MTTPQVLLTGATGYVGGRLLAALRRQGVAVRCLVRRPHHLRGEPGPDLEVVQGDVLDADSLPPALAGIETAYYLVHALAAGSDFVAKELTGARNFARAARAAGVRRVVYLGGLVPPGELSAHLASRRGVGRVLRDEGPPTVELRASIIIGSGSLSFEMIRALVQKLPVMITPSWTRRLAQPIAIEDVIDYLLAARELPGAGSEILEIGGRDQVTYSDLMQIYAEQRGLRRRLLRVPLLSPRLSSYWLGLVTPLQARIGAKLVDSIRHDTVVTDPRARELLPIRPRGVREAVQRAIEREDERVAATRWCDALSSSQAPSRYGGVRLGSRLVDSREIVVTVAPERAFAPVRRIGGRTGWYYGTWLWRLRGALDKLAGGPGLRRGRRDAEDLAVGDALDFWRVRDYEPDRLLRLRAEMRLPGRAWLQFEVRPEGNAGSRIRQTAIFDPRGLSGLLYWYALWPVHQLVFAGMLRRIGRLAGAGPVGGPNGADAA